jgi:hypothetical protein
MNRTLKAILLSVGLCSLPNLSFSATVYDNLSSPDLGQQYAPTPASLEFGDQITLGGTERTLSQFSFYYFLSGNSASTQNMTLRLYSNTGVTNSPASTALYTSDPIPVNLSFNTQTITFTNVITPIILPDTFTWTVQFSNLAAGQTGGLLLYGPPIPPGSSFNDFWQKDGAGNWSTMLINGGATRGDFAARVTAVPEPGVLALGGLGALVLAGLRRFRKA